MSQLRLITHHYDDPVLDTAISTALLQRIALGEIGPTLRIFTPSRIVAFGSQDRTRPGYAAAVTAVSELGYSGVERLAGGRAAVFHEGTIAFAWSTPHPDPKTGIEERYEALTSIIIDALGSLGVAGVVGELPGEYCPGRFSVHADGHKVMGVGQRLIKNAAHVGGVLVVHSPDLVNLPLIPAYQALDYEWDPAATGSIGGTTSVDRATRAMVNAFEAAGYALVPSEIGEETLALATALSDRHRTQIL
jgi:lipoate-protein ligase A